MILKQGEYLELKNPERYKGVYLPYSQGGGTSQVLKAIIKPAKHPANSTWVELEIFFENGVKWFDSSPSITGAKMLFALRCGTKSKWEVKTNEKYENK